MAYYRGQLDVRRLIDAVFAYLANFSNTQEWDAGFVFAKRRGGGRVTVGTQFALHLAFQWIGRRACEGLRAALNRRRANQTRS